MSQTYETSKQGESIRLVRGAGPDDTIFIALSPSGHLPGSNEHPIYEPETNSVINPTSEPLGTGDYDLSISVRDGRASGSFEGDGPAVFAALANLTGASATTSARHQPDDGNFSESDRAMLRRLLQNEDAAQRYALPGGESATQLQMEADRQALAEAARAGRKRALRSRVVWGAAGWLVAGSVFAHGTGNLDHGVIGDTVAVAEGPVQSADAMMTLITDIQHIGGHILHIFDGVPFV